MNLRLIILDTFVPSSIKAAKIRELFMLTAAAFKVTLPDLTGLKYRELLEKYACFTKAESDKIVNNAHMITKVRGRLFKSAVETGLRLKRQLKIQSFNEVLAASRIFYRILGIDFSGDSRGNITIRKCFFSRYFSTETCCLISALDEGMARGLSGGELQFTQRITDKKNCCKANLIFTH